MENYRFEWDSQITNCVDIKADSKAAAYHAWHHKKYGTCDITKETILGNTVLIDGEEYHNGIFKKIVSLSFAG